MSPMWKAALALAVTLSLGAFVAGALVASSADGPAPRETIMIRDAPGTERSEPRQRPGKDPAPTRPAGTDDEPRGRGEDDRGEDEVEVVHPEPDTVDDDDRGGRDDDTGGGGDDDRDDDGDGDGDD